MVAADFDAYWEAQRAIDGLWLTPDDMVAQEHPQHRAHGLVLVRPHHPRIRARHLERAGRLSPPRPVFAKASPTRPKPSCPRQILELDRQLAPPVRMLIDRARDIDLLDARRAMSSSAIATSRDGVAPRKEATAAKSSARIARRRAPQHLAQLLLRPAARIVALAGIEAEPRLTRRSWPSSQPRKVGRSCVLKVASASAG